MRKSAVRGLFPIQHGDISQLVNSRYCVIILCVLAISDVIMVSLFYPTPIECFCPAEMTTQQCDMLSSTCLTPIVSKRHAYYRPTPDEQLSESDKLDLSPFYQFVALLLLLQAGLFYAPHVISRELSRCSGINPDELSLAALEARRTKDVDERQTAVKDIAAHIHSFCLRQLRRRHMSYAFRWLYGMKLNLVQLLAKSLYVANVIGQFYMLDELLGFNFHSVGWILVGRTPTSAVEVSSSLLDEVNSKATPTFPFEIICDAEFRALGNIQRRSMHCALPINTLNEVIFHHVWFILFVVAVVSSLFLLVAIVKLILFPCRRMNIRDRLYDFGTLDNVHIEQSSKNVNIFEAEFLRMDGMLLLEYVEAGGGDIISDMTLSNIWNMYNEMAIDQGPMIKPLKRTERVIDVFKNHPTNSEQENTHIMEKLSAEA